MATLVGRYEQRLRDRGVVLGVLALALTVLDAAGTHVLLTTGRAIEGNPLLAQLVAAAGPAPAMLVRVTVGALLLGALVALRHRTRLALPGLVLVTVALATVGGIHGVALGALLASL